jgi:hypothetical protein
VRVCTVCQHPQLDAINLELVHGASVRDVAKQYGPSPAATHRHSVAHIPRTLARRAAGESMAHDQAHGQFLQDRLNTYMADLHRLRRKAERKGDYRTAIGAIRELTRLAELEARAKGELRAPAGNPQTLVQVNTGSGPVDHAEAVRYAKLLLEFEADEERDRELAAQETTLVPESKP